LFAFELFDDRDFGAQSGFLTAAHQRGGEELCEQPHVRDQLRRPSPW
jgi:hypothetical protein